MNIGIHEKAACRTLEILYQDRHLVAVNKPAGILVHRSPVDRRERTAIVQMLRNQIHQYVYPVHRLDRPTSGVLLFALSPETARKAALLFHSHRIIKRYIAVVRGHTLESGTVDHPVKEVKDNRIPFQDPKADNRYPAHTVYRRLATVELPVAVGRYPSTRYSLVELLPQTGRRHQLRKHMRHISHPIIGDTRYGQTVHNRFFRSQFQCRGLLLCATDLTLPHPEHGKEICITAPLSSEFQNIISRFQWKGCQGSRMQPPDCRNLPFYENKGAEEV